jgi:hypothetical protein
VQDRIRTNGKKPEPPVLSRRPKGGYSMAIFARLVCMIFAVLFSAGLAGGLAQSSHCQPFETILAAIVGAVVGIFIGRSIGNMVVGKPPQA